MVRAVVLGGGFAGVLAAAAVARHAAVTVVEAGRYPAGPGVRSGVPQAHHSHVLVTGGAQALDRLLPGTLATLYARGARRYGLADGALIGAADGWFRRHETGAYLVSCSRWLLDHVVRQRVLDTVAVRERTAVLGLTGTAGQVTGVTVQRPDGTTGTLPADLVVDATGRRSRADRWLAALGAPPVAEETIDPGVAYATRVYSAPAQLAGIPAVMLHPHGRRGHGATLFPIEDDRWIVTLTGTRRAAPPVHEQGFTDCAYALPSSVIAELMAAAKPLGGVRPYRATVNRRRFVELGQQPAGFLALGDALAAVNPVHSHGLSVAARAAVRLAAELDRRGPDPAACGDIQSALAAEADPSWQMATAGDRPGPTRAPSPFERVAEERARRALLTDPAAMDRFFRQQTLVPAGPAGAAAGDAAPIVTTDEAVAQYPELAEWWLGRRPRPRSRPLEGP